jgi:hypothetical protein
MPFYVPVTAASSVVDPSVADPGWLLEGQFNFGFILNRIITWTFLWSFEKHVVR